MTSITPAPATKPKQNVALFAVLGVLVVVALVFFVIKPFDGGDDADPGATATTAAVGQPATAKPKAPASTLPPDNIDGAIAQSPADYPNKTRRDPFISLAGAKGQAG